MTVEGIDEKYGFHSKFRWSKIVALKLSEKTLHCGLIRARLIQIYFDNSVHEDGGDLYSFKTRPIISSDGTLNWLTPAILKTTCKLDISKFPFDEQKCILKIGSWTYPSFALDLNVSKDQERAGLENYTENTEWDLLSVDTRKSNKKYSCCFEPYHDLTYTFHFRRKPWYYIISIVFPCIVLSLLASISFLFPAESGERISLVISILLGLTVFMLIVNDRTPVSSDGTPMITRYFSAICFTVLVILLATAFILRIYHESPSSPVPYYLASLRDFFVVVLFMKTSGEEARRRDLAKTARLSYLRQLNACSKNQLSMDKILFQFQRSVIRQEEDFTNQLKEDWQCTARVFDILFFCLFLLVFLVLNIYVFSFL